MQAKTLKITISGPGASGKTALARVIGEKYGLAVIDEDVAPIFEARNQINRLRHEGAPAEAIIEAKKKWMASFVHWMKERDRAYANSPGFVADRWEADLLDLWLVSFAQDRNVDLLTTQMVKNLYAKAQSIDFAIMLPLAKPLGEGKAEAELSQMPTFTSRLLNSMITNGIIHTVPNLPVLRIPAEALTLDDRMSLVDKAVRARRG